MEIITMDDIRLENHVTHDCLERFKEKLVDGNSSMDIEKVCRKKRKRTFYMIEENSEKQHPMFPVTMEKHNDTFYCIKHVSPFNVLLTQVKIFLQASQNIIPSLFPRSIETQLMQEEPPVYLVNNNCSAQYIGYKISCLTLMMMALECFVNENIPNDFNAGEDNNGEVRNKEYVERRWSLEQKMQAIRESKSIIDSQYNTLMSRLRFLYDLRNDFVHLKSGSSNKEDPCVDCYERLLGLDLNLDFNRFKEYVKLVQPDIVLD